MLLRFLDTSRLSSRSRLSKCTLSPFSSSNTSSRSSMFNSNSKRTESPLTVLLLLATQDSLLLGTSSRMLRRLDTRAVLHRLCSNRLTRLLLSNRRTRQHRSSLAIRPLSPMEDTLHSQLRLPTPASSSSQVIRASSNLATLPSSPSSLVTLDTNSPATRVLSSRDTPASNSKEDMVDHSSRAFRARLHRPVSVASLHRRLAIPVVLTRTRLLRSHKRQE